MSPFLPSTVVLQCARKRKFDAYRQSSRPSMPKMLPISRQVLKFGEQLDRELTYAGIDGSKDKGQNESSDGGVARGQDQDLTRLAPDLS
ncbi:Uu.00g050310.m01.CDS01 [Anthostomella pinea]|uniref:Uu.00g050310.m01.CDS01 n=1 Tax=Anthostomella pinea TaxID=933095 RepID=A0AAI8VSP1_9PEZI|nr:Uu.00g050310.m01.CDS01 [Anthostomella pinea]